jgi:hypothetical protein
MVHAFSDEQRKYAVRLLAADVGKLERELNAANDRIKRLEEALDTLVKMHRSFIGKDDGITHERSYYCFYKGQYDHWKKAINVLEAKEAKL